jgi:hypothetical protein
MSDRQELLLAPAAVERADSKREALHSIFRRTCERNQLLVNDVVNDLMLPLAGPALDRMRKLVKPLHLMNRGAGLSDRFIARMKAFSTVQSWDHATLKELIELEGIGALPISARRRWCAQCYDDDCFQPHGPYDRLLWSIELVATCPVHQVRLEDSCDSCGATNLPVLMGVDISGFCPRCWQFLGGRRLRLDGDRDDYARFLLWTSRAIADLLDEPLPKAHDANGPFLSMLRRISDYHFSGAYAHLAAAISRNKSVVGTWFAGRAKPGWRVACEISYCFQIPLRDLLAGDETAVAFSVRRPLPLSAQERNLSVRRRPIARDREYLKAFLAEVEQGLHPILSTMTAVGRRLAIDPSQLRKILPAECASLCKALTDRRAESSKRARRARLTELEVAIRQVGEDLAANDGPLTRRNVELRLRHLGFNVRRPDSKNIRERVADAKCQALQQMSGSS